MLVLTIRTNEPAAEVALFDSAKQAGGQKWQAHRELSVTIHNKIEAMLGSASKSWSDLEGVVFFAGPGSFTGLRIGASVAGALAYGLKIPIVSVRDKDWAEQGIRKLKAGEDEKTALPFYGGEPHITKPKK
jgi:tRNA threonylcarbamoyladenosine biosynthesis protein TsaB